ncbi:nucleotidyltransferase family protein [Lachnospira multipara]|uniref:nucleotidyltransferase domain-containing protein n=1 Tax=Lachnospira multipara TaxID=28051 RepID=UPI000488ACF6|nr:nucleotidyltransferase family protein [Lachnospira multipara]
MNNTININFLRDLILSQLHNEEINSVPEDVNIDDLCRLASLHQMEYILLAPLLKLDIDNAKKESISARLSRDTFIDLGQRQQIKNITTTFESYGLDYLLMKGSILKEVYPKSVMRQMGDIDLMIYDTTMNRSRELFKFMGYNLEHSVKIHDVYKKEPFWIVEAHWSLFDKNVDKNIYDYYQERRATLKEGTKATYELSIEDFYVYMIAHMAKHFYENGCGIRNLVDIYVYLEHYKNQLNYDKLVAELEKCGLSTFEYQSRRLAYDWLEKKELDEMELSLFYFMLDCGVYGKGENGFWSQFAKQANADESIDKVITGKWYLFPPISYMKEFYPKVAKYPILLPWYWLVRGVRGLTHKERRRRRVELTKIDQTEAKTIVDLYKNMGLDFTRTKE